MAVNNCRNWAVFLGRFIRKTLNSHGSKSTIAGLDRKINLSNLAALNQTFATVGNGLVFAGQTVHFEVAISVMPARSYLASMSNLGFSEQSYDSNGQRLALMRSYCGSSVQFSWHPVFKYFGCSEQTRGVLHIAIFGKKIAEGLLPHS